MYGLSLSLNECFWRLYTMLHFHKLSNLQHITDYFLCKLKYKERKYAFSWFLIESFLNVHLRIISYLDFLQSWFNDSEIKKTFMFYFSNNGSLLIKLQSNIKLLDLKQIAFFLFNLDPISCCPQVSQW